jgi:hypothetical protein
MNTFSINAMTKKIISTQVNNMSPLRIFTSINNHFEKNRFIKIWTMRNLDHGDVIIKMLELEVLQFQQNIFLEDTTDINTKLSRVGFKPYDNLPIKSVYSHFSKIMYNKEFNLAVNLYNPSYKTSIILSIKIAEGVRMDPELTNNVFMVSINTLLKMGTK